MPKKGEHIYKRKDGRWEGRYRSGTDMNGKAIYQSVYGKSYYAVKNKLTSCVETKGAAKSPAKQSPMFKDVISLWQKTNANRYKGATALKYENLINNHILPELGGYKLSELNKVLLASFMSTKLNRGRMDRTGGLSPSYVRSIMLVVLEIIDFAAEENLCSVPNTRIHKPPIEKNELEILDAITQSYLERQLIMAPDETGAGILLSLNTGLRIGEVCALKWTDIDFENAILHIRTTVARVKDETGK